MNTKIIAAHRSSRPRSPARHAARTRGASLVSYGLLTGLIAVGAIGAVNALGGRVAETFETAARAVVEQEGLTGGAGNEAAPPDPNTAPTAVGVDIRLGALEARPGGLAAGTLLARYALSDDTDAAGDLNIVLDAAAPLGLVRDGADVEVVVAPGQTLGIGAGNYALTITDSAGAAQTVTESFTVTAVPNDAPAVTMVESRLENRLAGTSGLPDGALLARYTLSDDHDAASDLGVSLDTDAPLALERAGSEIRIVVAPGAALPAGDVDYTLIFTDLEGATETVAVAFTIGVFAGAVNGSFEAAAPGAAVTITGWGRTASALAGWTEANGITIEQLDGANGGGFAPYDGAWAVDMQELLSQSVFGPGHITETDPATQANLTLSQEIAIDPWSPLTVSLWMYPPSGPFTDRLVVTWQDASGITTQTFTPAGTTWENATLAVAAPMDGTVTTGTLTVDTVASGEGHPADSIGIYIDAVTVTQDTN
mgnify:CR=1 FL=1